MKGSEFVFSYLHLLYYKCSSNKSDSPDWIKNKKATINPIIKKDDKCFQYAVTKIKSFINKYNLEEINFPSDKDDWEKIEKNNLTIAANVLHAKK